MEDLSVIIITRNRLEKLKRSVQSVKAVLSGSELIVVDNNSSDGTREYLKSLGDCRIILLNSNEGVAGARNIGVEASKKSFVMFLDDDAWIFGIDFKKIKEYFFHHADVGLIAPKVLYPDGRIQESARSFPSLLALFWRGTGLYRLFPDVSWYRKFIDQDTGIAHRIDWSIGACQIIRRDLFEKIGFLDNRYFFGYEDVDFCLRMEKNGSSCLYWPDAIVYHDYTRTSSRGLNVYLLRHIRSIARYFYKSWFVIHKPRI